MRKNPEVKTTLFRGKVDANLGINITWKLGKQKNPEVFCFAPEKKYSNAYMNGQMSWESYREKYLDKLNEIPQEVLMPAVRALFDAGEEITLLCYCSPRTKHCHLVLLIEWLVFRFPKAFEKPQCLLF